MAKDEIKYFEVTMPDGERVDIKLWASNLEMATHDPGRLHQMVCQAVGARLRRTVTKWESIEPTEQYTEL